MYAQRDPLVAHLQCIACHSVHQGLILRMRWTTRQPDRTENELANRSVRPTGTAVRPNITPRSLDDCAKRSSDA